MEYEIHFAAQAGEYRESLRSGIYGLGFRDDMLLGEGVVFPPRCAEPTESCPLHGLHVTWDTFDRGEYLRTLSEFKDLLKTEGPTCVGYAHAEVIRPEWDVPIEGGTFDPRVQYPLERFESSPSRTPKKWDIHISAYRESLDEQLERVLFDEAGMYYIDLRKSDGTVKRVFTIQGTSHVRDGLKLFEALKKYVEGAGGMTGAIKLEQTCYWAEYGALGIVPPIIAGVRYR